jgi:hypothetical protein
MPRVCKSSRSEPVAESATSIHFSERDKRIKRRLASKALNDSYPKGQRILPHRGLIHRLPENVAQRRIQDKSEKTSFKRKRKTVSLPPTKTSSSSSGNSESGYGSDELAKLIPAPLPKPLSPKV